MSRKCQVRGTGPMAGNNVSHSNKKTRMRQLPNIQSKRFFIPSENRWVRLKVSTSALRDIDKKGIETVIAELRRQGQKI